jgi:hypothetical protein
MPRVQIRIRNSVFHKLAHATLASQEKEGPDIGPFCPNGLTFGQNCPIVAAVNAARQTDKRDRFIAEIRSEARAMGLSFRVDYRKGKGGHAVVYVGDRLTTLPSREIDPKTARKIRKQLGLAD